MNLNRGWVRNGMPKPQHFNIHQQQEEGQEMAIRMALLRVSRETENDHMTTGAQDYCIS